MPPLPSFWSLLWSLLFGWLENISPALTLLLLVISISSSTMTLALLTQMEKNQRDWVRRGAAFALGVMLCLLLVVVMVYSLLLMIAIAELRFTP